MSADRLMASTAEVCRHLGIGRTSLYEITRADSTFPRPVPLGKRNNRWFLDELRAWLASRPRVEICTGVPAAPKPNDGATLHFDNSRPPSGTGSKPPPARKRKRVRR